MLPGTKEEEGGGGVGVVVVVGGGGMRKGVMLGWVMVWVKDQG